jgi:hypothetical protein
MESIERINIYLPSKMFSSQLVNPAVLPRAKLVEYAISHKSRPIRSQERFDSLPLVTSSVPAYAASQPSTSQVVVQSISRKSDPHIGSNEYYGEKVSGVQILRKYNNIYIPQLLS